MNFTGIIIGAAVFLSIGICHPITIKLEYYFGRKGYHNRRFCVLVFLGYSRGLPAGDPGLTRLVSREPETA